MNIRRIVTNFTIALVVLAVLVAATVDPVAGLLAGFLRPILGSVEQTGGNVTRTVDSMFPLADREKRRLKRLDKRVDDLELRLARLRHVREENDDLRTFLELPPRDDWHTVVAPVIARDPVAWNRQFRIGRGRREGVELGAAVLEGATVIGRITSAAQHTAVVSTVAAPSCKLSVTLSDTDAVGILKGRLEQEWYGDPVCLADYLPRDGTYRPGETVLTSGLSTKVPGGLNVGRVIPWDEQKTHRIVNTSYAQVKVRPTASFGDVRYVSVICKHR